MDDTLGETRAAEDDARTVLNAPLDVRSLSLAVMAVLACVFVLRWAEAVFIPLLIGVMLSYALTPVVDRLEKWRLPRGMGAALVVGLLVTGVAATAESLRDDAAQLVETLPATAQKLREAMRPARGVRASPLEQVQKAAAELEQVATQATAGASTPASARGVTRVVVEQRKFDLSQYLWSSTLGIAALVFQAVVVCFLTFFLLASGDAFRRKLVKIAGPTFTKKKITVQMLNEITEQIQRYLLVQVFTSALVGITTGLAFYWIGLEQAAVWGLMAGVLNLVPYLGAIVVTGGAALVGFVQFGSLEQALLVGGASLVIQVIEGYLLTPWLTSRASRMSPVVVFVCVLAFGWLWGVWGLLLGVPILMVVKSVCDRIDDLKPVGELLGQ